MCITDVDRMARDKVQAKIITLKSQSSTKSLKFNSVN